MSFRKNIPIHKNIMSFHYTFQMNRYLLKVACFQCNFSTWIYIKYCIFSLHFLNLNEFQLKVVTVHIGTTKNCVNTLYLFSLNRRQLMIVTLHMELWIPLNVVFIKAKPIIWPPNFTGFWNWVIELHFDRIGFSNFQFR